MASDRTWISDGLIRLTGASDATLVDFVAATAGSAAARGPKHLRDKLADLLEDAAAPAELQKFADELYARTTKGGGKTGGAAKDGGAAASGARLAKKRYALVEMEDDLVDAPPAPAPVSAGPPKSITDFDKMVIEGQLKPFVELTRSFAIPSVVEQVRSLFPSIDPRCH